MCYGDLFGEIEKKVFKKVFFHTKDSFIFPTIQQKLVIIFQVAKPVARPHKMDVQPEEGGRGVIKLY